MLATGVRPGEAVGLMWSDVTFRPDGSAAVSIERTRSVSRGKVYEDTPKTERGRRDIFVTGDALALLKEAKAHGEREKLARLIHNGCPHQETGYVFTSRAGTPYRPDNLRRPMRRLSLAAGVPLLTPHDLRHTWTSLEAAGGKSVEVLSKHLGHANASVTRDVYRHVFDEERADLTYDPVTPLPVRKRIKVRIRRAEDKVEESQPSVPTKVRKMKRKV